MFAGNEYLRINRRDAISAEKGVSILKRPGSNPQARFEFYSFDEPLWPYLEIPISNCYQEDPGVALWFIADCKSVSSLVHIVNCCELRDRARILVAVNSSVRTKSMSSLYGFECASEPAVTLAMEVNGMDLAANLQFVDYSVLQLGI